LRNSMIFKVSLPQTPCDCILNTILIHVI
jgi:hypothetical protein